jgi:hypothetical protein
LSLEAVGLANTIVMLSAASILAGELTSYINNDAAKMLRYAQHDSPHKNNCESQPAA